MSTFVILMDLLFENGRYEDVIKVMDEVKDRRVAGYKFPNDCLVLLAASCCKLVRDSLESSGKGEGDLAS